VEVRTAPGEDDPHPIPPLILHEIDQFFLGFRLHRAGSDTAPALASRRPLRVIQSQGQPRPLAATPKKCFRVKEAAGKGKKPTTAERSAEVRRPKVRDAILFWEENCNRNVQVK